jgi:DNA-binding SARP family transcriptional activator
MASLSVTLLGGFDARLSSGAPVHLPTKKAQALLAYLALRSGRADRRDKLAALLWGERSDDLARGALRRVLADLRRALAGAHPAPVRIEGHTLALDPDSVEVDVVMLERCVAEATPQALERAAELYRGDLLLGFTVDEPLFEEWLVAERERLREMALDALARLLAHQTTEANSERAIRTAVRLLALDPLQEAVHRSLMRLYVRQGRRGAALKQYQACVAALRRELGAEPEEETRQLYQEMLRRPDGRAQAAAVRNGHRPAPIAPPLPDLPAAETPLFGRAAEMGQLRERLDAATRARGQVATVVGEAGIGKTRLVTALAADALSLGYRVLIGRCHESDSILPFGPWVDACRAGGITGDEGVVGALPVALRAELVRLFPEAGEAHLPPASDSALRLFESVSALIEQAALRQPLVVVMEDLHWADEMSLRLLSFVSRRVPAWSALLVTTARDDELPEESLSRRTIEQLSTAPGATPVALSPLSRTETARLVRALTRVGSNAETLTRVEDRIWTMSEGNPFVVVEAMRVLADDRPGHDGHAQPGALALPARVRELVTQRLNRLSPPTQHVAAVAAVIGRRFDFALLQSASALDDGDAAQAVEEMVRQRVLQAVGDELDFTHDRVRDVAYGRLLLPRRRLLHRAVAEALEAMGVGNLDATDGPSRDRRDEQIEQLAHHALHGELRDRAVRYFRRAGEKAAARSSLHDARAWLERARDVADALPESRPALEEAFEVRVALRSVLMQLAEFERCLAVLREADALAERLDDDRRRGRVSAFLANMHTRLDDPDTGLVHGRRSRDIAERLGDVRLRILATSFLAQAHFCRGEFAPVVELATANLAALAPETARDLGGSSQATAVSDRFRLIVSLAHLGRFAEAPPHEAEVIRLAEAMPHAYSRALAYNAASVLHLVKGDWMTAHAMIERHIEALRTANNADELPQALAYSAHALTHVGDARMALGRLREAERILANQAAGRKTGTGYTYLLLGRASLDLGLLHDAQRLADRAAAPALTRVDVVPHGHHLLGDIAIHPDRFDAERAESRYREALAMAEARGMRPLVAQCHLGLGTVYARLGEPEHARPHLAAAATMFREMGMLFWLGEAEWQSAAIGVAAPQDR